MKRIYKIMRDKKGEGYIDAAVVVFCVMFVIALGVRIFPVFITKIQLDNFADELVREAEISGRVGSETTARQRTLEKKTGIHPAVSWSGCEFPYKSRVMGTSEPLKPLKAPYMARNPVKWGFFRLKGQEIPLKI